MAATAGKDYVVIASDTRLSDEGYEVAHASRFAAVEYICKWVSLSLFWKQQRVRNPTNNLVSSLKFGLHRRGRVVLPITKS